MNNIWLLFIFIIVALLAYLMYSGGSNEDKTPVAGANEMMQQILAPREPEEKEPQYQEVGDESDNKDE